MNILWLSWKDENHPQAGGAEVVSSELRRRLVKNGHRVKLITAEYKGSLESDIIKGVEVYRTGNRYSVYTKSRKLFKEKLPNWPDLIVDEMNTVPFFGYKYSSNTPCVLLTYQLARKVWFYQMPHPLSLLGYLVEPIYLRFISKKYVAILTESESTKKDLMDYGFEGSKIHVFRVGMFTKPVSKIKIKNSNRLLFLGSVRPMKRTLHAIKAFVLAKLKIPDLTLDIAGDYSGSYGEKVYKYAGSSDFSDSIVFHGKVSHEKKEELLENSGLIIVTSIKEGWGLIATEAAAYGVPAIAYNVDGLRDSIIDGQTGLLAPSGEIKSLSRAIHVALNDKSNLERMGRMALENSRQYTFENSYADFTEVINKVMENNEE